VIHSDSQNQRQLKQTTNAARVWRANEYQTVTASSIASGSFETYLRATTDNAQDRLANVTAHLTPAISPVKSHSATEDKENVGEA